MRDEPWWKQQWLCTNMKRPLIQLHDWCYLSPGNDTVAVMEEGLPEQQQEVVRELVGDTVYRREVLPKLSGERRVARGRERVLVAVGLSSQRHGYTVHNESTSEVYPQLTPAFFNRLTQYLPEPCIRYILDDEYNEYAKLKHGAGSNKPYCQWLLGCWDAVLLPKCPQWITRASVNIEMVQGLPQPYQRACLIHKLSCLSNVIQLSLRVRSNLVGE